MTFAQVVAFAGVMLLGALAPGPDFAVVVRQAATGGRRAGMAAAAGIAAGVFVWAATAALGVAALLAASATAYTVVKVAGAAYLLYLGVRSLLAARRGGGVEPAAEGGRRASAWAGFRQGLLTNVLNPKAAAFFVALMPQFLGDDPRVGGTLVLSAVATLVAGAWFLVVANVVGALRQVFSRERVRRTIDGVTGAALIGLGVRMASD
ncbi:LysE family translocator [Actinomadura kijaniata]|uniref:RhtB (Resistance to homoserine/threonine) family protein n=1 Tax=Actinomadura namibiensis TaxID=182080 RepID=A0A7W3LSC2_ACTNM|nr:LysE family translocator [Actinomadura namibiensis]MBA8953317.1 RhtB (resistance to homoserine/threonine) family protein [Actinomadura namibiensis]